MAWKWLQDRRTIEQWNKMKRRGHGPYIAQGVLLWICCYACVRLVHIEGFKAGLFSSPGMTSWTEIFFSAALPGSICAELNWSDMKKKFSRAERNEPIA
jgi:hypothetical protein